MKTCIKIIIGIIIITYIASAQTETPKVFSLDGKKISSFRQSYLNGDLKNDIIKIVIKDGQKYMDMEPVSVMQKGQNPPNGDKHDYMSMGKYWWPNPDTKDGLPFIRKDGEVNPATNDVIDHEKSENLAQAVSSLSFAYYITDDSKFSDKAAQLIRVWFLNDDTKMNPNLNYAQAIEGKNDGRGSGIIDLHEFPEIIDAVGLIENSKSWTKEDDSKIKLWFSQYLDWLTTSKNGKDESKAKNNHGSWYDYQVASIALFLDKTDMAKKYLEEVKSKRIAVQIKPDGTEPFELVRTTSWHYSVFNIEALCNLAKLGDKVGVNLWNYESPEGGSIRKALDFVLPFALNPDDWKYPQIKKINTESLYTILLEAKRNFDEKVYSDWITKIFGDKMDKSKKNILY